MGKIKIYEIAKKLGLTSKEVLEAAEKLNIEVKSHMSGVGEEEAKKAQDAARALFAGGAEGGSIPTTEIPASKFGDGMDILTLLSECGLIASKSEGRRLVQQNGLKLNDEKVTAFDYIVTSNDIKDGKIKIQKGKKVFHHVKLV